MSALSLGLIAAFSWAFHDICVRYVSQRTPLMAMLLTVLIVALAFHLGLMIVTDSFAPLAPEALWVSILSGALFLMASLGLYGAFQRGPVRLVAPIIASYPLLSVAWAIIRGAEISWPQWIAVLVIIAGVSIVAALADDDSNQTPPKGPTIALSLMASIGFAGTFALGQYASEISGHMPVTLATRVTAIILLALGMAAMRLPFWTGRSAIPIIIAMGLADGIALLCVISAGTLPNPQYAAVAASCFGLLTIVIAWAVLRAHVTTTMGRLRTRFCRDWLFGGLNQIAKTLYSAAARSSTFSTRTAANLNSGILP